MLARTPLNEKIGFALSRIIVPLWILAGVVFKLESGNARNLPSNIVDFARSWLMDLGTVLYTLIALEIFAILIMVFIARLARPMAMFMLTVFCLILIGEMVKGADKCGCFGGTIAIEPWQMFIADAILLVGVVLFRPKADYGPLDLSRAAAIATASLVVGFAVSFGVGHTLHGQGADDQRVQLEPVDPDDPDANPSPSSVPPYWYPRDVPGMVGKDWRELEIFQFMRRWPAGLDEGKHYVVFYSRTCGHCQTMFEMDLIFPFDAPVIAIDMPLSQDAFGEPWEMPDIDEGVVLMSLPSGPDWSLVQAPLAMRIEDGIVTCAEERDHKRCFELK